MRKRESTGQVKLDRYINRWRKKERDCVRERERLCSSSKMRKIDRQIDRERER